ncbi:DNA-binding protein [Streptantibioticus cattleyicolor NRRL 8057 = DSM 46488]|uniref:DNA-binding protein n=2 Tax=Kitasatosporales TaxID=85011 RepID=F8K3K2_STREN|nr:DNA-binding protein [Streptantibioticus cattleyicolor NRRL 8057 = DSM 46488]CCB76660.1 putative DNA-binding protein [Streptantibioticus cattleyicolor NRRL 8057 = DSM 46488]
MSVAEAAALMGMRQPHLSNAEAARTGLSPDRVRLLATTVGGISTTYIEALIELGQSSGKGWWSTYRGLLDDPHLDLAELESGATGLDNYEPMFIPGLLQTRGYAEAIYRDGYANLSEEDKEAAVRFRIDRQDVLRSEAPPEFHAIVHEAALHLGLRDRTVMRDQLIHLIEVSRLPNVTIQVLPFEGRVGFGSGFMVIRPIVPELATAVVSHIERDLYLEGTQAVGKYQGWFGKLSEQALPPIDASVPPDARLGKNSLGLVQRLLYPLL